MSVKSKVLNYLKGVDKADKYQIRHEVNAWKRHYDEQTIDRQLQRLVKEEVLLSKRHQNKMWYKMNEKAN